MRGVIATWAIAAMVLASSAAAEPVVLTGRAMGTTWTVKYVDAPGRVSPRLVERRVGERLEQLEQAFSTFRPASEVSLFNSQPGRLDWVRVSPEVVAAASAARAISEATDGGFDVTVQPLVALWGFGPAATRTAPPAVAEIEAVRHRVGWRALEARANPAALRRTQPGIAADFSSVAKGYAADEVGRVFHALGLENHFVQIGGDIKTTGRAVDGQPWRIGIEQPGDGVSTLGCVVGLAGQAVSTSGNYRNALVAGGRRVGHIIDPRTGYPVANDLVAVSVVADACAASSAWATGLFVLGADQARAVAERHGLACLLIVRAPDGSVTRRTTARFDGVVVASAAAPASTARR